MKIFFLAYFTLIVVVGCKVNQIQKSNSEIFQGKDNEWTTKNITQNRNMSQYDQGGHFGCSTRNFSNDEDIFSGEKKVRDFIWQHWELKKLGYIKISCGGIDTSDTTHYFVEQDEKGGWIVSIIVLYKHTIDVYDNRPIQNFVADSIEKVESKIKDEKVIILKTKNNKTIGEIPLYY